MERNLLPLASLDMLLDYDGYHNGLNIGLEVYLYRGRKIYDIQPGFLVCPSKGSPGFRYFIPFLISFLSILVIL